VRIAHLSGNTATVMERPGNAYIAKDIMPVHGFDPRPGFVPVLFTFRSQPIMFGIEVLVEHASDTII
jgi:hypothetical protein